MPIVYVTGGAAQTMQRIGAAIGTAPLTTIFYQVLTRTRHDYSVAVSDALLAAGGSMLLALLMALAELTRRRWPAPHPTDGPNSSRTTRDRALRVPGAFPLPGVCGCG